ncbi:MAG: tetratricopeptide repeat protein [Desulfococcaceae bacterium]
MFIIFKDFFADNFSYKRIQIFFCLFLLIAVFGVYRQVMYHEFVDFDDDMYITENLHVQKGLSSESIKWAFRFTEDKSYWHPLTWLSHMLDVEMYSINPGRYLLNNVFFHFLSAIILFLFLVKSTGQIWKSAFVVSVFALHPLNVESVAWVSERKNVLSTFFWMLTMLFYYYYSQRPALIRYLLVLFCFLMGILAKPMVITLPFVLLLLDYWPLERFRFIRTDFSRIRFLIAEKIPLFAVSGISVFLSIVSLHYSTIVSTDPVPMGLRIENALVSYFAYIGKMFFPYKLAVFYPYPYQIALWKSLGYAVLLIGITWFILRNMKDRPYGLMGWFWFLGTMVPVLGIKRAGLWPALADRWSYIPLVGLFIIFSWGVSDISDRLPKKRIILSVLSALIISILATLTFIQIGYWQNAVSLFTRAASVTENNWLMHFNLGAALEKQGKTEEAIIEYRKSLHINPHDEDTRYSLAAALSKIGQTEEAVSEYNTILKKNPRHKNAHNNMGILLAEKGKFAEAIKHYSTAIQLDPDFDLAYINRGSAFFSLGKTGEAIKNYLKAVECNPSRLLTYKNLAAVYAAQQDYNREIYWYLRALHSGFHDADIHNALGIALLRKGKLKDAAVHFRLSCESEPENPLYRKHLADTAEEMENIKKKLAEIEKKMKQNPDDFHLHYESCVLCTDIGETEQAIRHCRISLEKNPNFPDALEKLAILYIAVKDYSSAVSLYERLSALSPDSAEICYSIACLYAMLNVPDRAVEWLAKSAEKGFDDWELIKTDSRLGNIRHTDYYQSLILKNGK